jgi:hypothetical protein
MADYNRQLTAQTWPGYHSAGGEVMASEVKLDPKKLKVFKVRNRSGYAAIYDNNLTEGMTQPEAISRMMKAVKRKAK